MFEPPTEDQNREPDLQRPHVSAVVDVDVMPGASTDLAALIEGGMMEVVSSGNGIPLIDLSEVSDELNQRMRDQLRDLTREDSPAVAERLRSLLQERSA